MLKTSLHGWVTTHPLDGGAPAGVGHLPSLSLRFRIRCSRPESDTRPRGHCHGDFGPGGTLVEGQHRPESNTRTCGHCDLGPGSPATWSPVVKYDAAQPLSSFSPQWHWTGKVVSRENGLHPNSGGRSAAPTSCVCDVQAGGPPVTVHPGVSGPNDCG